MKKKKTQKGLTAWTMFVLTKRNIKLFLKDRATVFFSVLAPIIVLLLYIFFLGDLQTNSIVELVKEYGMGEVVTKSDIHALINNWMISGVMAVSCISVALNASIVMVRDRASGAVNDVLSSPVKRWVFYASYVVSCCIITFIICLIVLLVSIIYLACSGGLMLNAKDFFAILGITLLSCISSAFCMVLLCGFIKTVGLLSAINGVVGAAIGFFIGAYLPFSMLPKAMQYVACFVPGTYSGGLYRNYFMRGIIEKLQMKVGDNGLVEKLMSDYSVKLQFFGTTISAAWMVFAIVASIVLFGSLILILYSNKRTNFFMLGKKAHKSKRNKSAKNKKSA